MSPSSSSSRTEPTSSWPDHAIGNRRRSLRHRGRFAAVTIVCALLLAAGCTQHPRSAAPAPVIAGAATASTVGPATEVQVGAGQTDRLIVATGAGTRPPLDVVVVQFAAGTGGDDAPLTLPKLRDAETRYFPYVLRQTLEASGHWASVRVLPDVDPSAEVIVTGRVIRSDGINLALHISAWDSSGQMWLEQQYRATTDLSAHQFRSAEAARQRRDPFASVYDRIANDLLAARERRTAREIQQVIDISQLRYAIDLAPDAFGQYLRMQDDGTVKISRLPADGDSILRRVNQLREREYELASLIDEHYGEFVHDIVYNYSLWRRFSHELIVDNQRLAEQVSRPQRTDDIRSLKRSYETYQNHKLNEHALREITDSFETSSATTVMELEGTVYRLTGNLDDQYQRWRQLLRRLYAEELGAGAL